MNKRTVNNWLERAVNAIEATGISENGVVDRTYRSHISSFGAAVTMGSLKAAVAFFSQQEKALVERPRLLSAMYYIIMDMKSKEEIDAVKSIDIFKYVADNDTPQTKEQFINASIALKLAMNLYDLQKNDKRG